MRYVYLVFFIIVVAAVSILGFRGTRTATRPLEIFSDMDNQPKYSPQGQSAFFSDGRASRMPVEGSVARGAYHEDEYLETGKNGADFGSGFPIEATATAMQQGRHNYAIYCSVCHGQVGDGNSMTKKYGMLAVANLTAEQYLNYPDGQIYDVITNGFNTMLPYADKLSEEERWQVVLYVRALQRAANGTANDLTPAKREELGL